MTSEQRVMLVYLVGAAEAAMLESAHAIADRTDTRYRAYLSREELSALVTPGDAARQAVQAWFEEAGLTVTWAPSPQLMFAIGTDAAFIARFGSGFANWVADPAGISASRALWALPPDIAGHVKGLQLRTAEDLEDLDPEAAIETMVAAPSASAEGSLGEVPEGLSGVTPADIRAVYAFPDAWTGVGETIGILNLGGVLDPDDLHGFWTAHGITREPVQRVRIGLPPSDTTGREPTLMDRLEITMIAEWIGAMAPDASIVVYDIDPELVSDPWSAFLTAACAPDLGAPTVVVGTWTLSERTYYRANGERVIRSLLEQATALGVTVIAASGDWGCYDGRPRGRGARRQTPVCHAPWPHAIFPSVEPRVLSVGGTVITHRLPRRTELAWSGPLPPSSERRTAIPMTRVASSGGFSHESALPDWQEAAVDPENRAYSRGANVPAVVPFGRAYPDVALMSMGPSVVRPDYPELSAEGYQALVGGAWIDWAGGTSLAAPVWSAIIARINHARVASGLPRVGFVTPHLYELAASSSSPFRYIDSGDSDVELRVVNSENRVVSWRLPGFTAVPGEWDPVTGLGVPDVSRLLDALMAS